jgi:dienelactone hydrolase
MPWLEAPETAGGVDARNQSGDDVLWSFPTASLPSLLPDSALPFRANQGLAWWKRVFAAALTLIALARGAAASEQIMVPVDYDGRRIELMGWFDKPAGPGPFPVVIALHSCSGYYANMYGGSLPLWVSFLQQQGYATFTFDSFTARGLSEVCGGGLLSGRQRAPDVLAAAIVLAQRPDVAIDRIAVIGFSHGGGTAIAAARDFPEMRPLRQSLAARGGKLAASVALYGGCGNRPEIAPVVMPLLALNGGLDDWSRPGPCVALASQPANRLMTLHIYPDAYHHFDAPIDSYSYGHRLLYNAADTADARQRALAFLDQFLRR